jgi:hypothetical protein
MVPLQRILRDLVRKVENWSAERDTVFANLPDNPWTYPGCGVHVKASDVFSGGSSMTIADSSSVTESGDTD